MVLFAAGARSALAAKSLQDMGLKKYLILKVDLEQLNKANLKQIVLIMLTYIIPFMVLILIVVFIHGMVYYFAKKYGVKLLIFQSVLVKKYLVGTINRVLDGRFAGSTWRLCYTVIMSIHKLIKKKF